MKPRPLLIALMLVAVLSLGACTSFAGSTDLASQLIDLLVAGDYAGVVSHFDDTMKTMLPAAKLAETWQALAQQVGKLQQQLESQSQPYQQYLIVIIPCKFEQATLRVKFVFDKQQRVAGFFLLPAESSTPWEAPDYADESAFREVQVTVGEGEWALPATLTLPKGDGPFAAVVLVHGSGPHDRDETVGPNKPFKDLAWGLASQGVAVLRYEKRTKAHAALFTRELQRQLTVQQETLDDAIAAVKLLRARPDIAGNHVFVLGHSLGGMLVPRLGKEDATIAGFIILAGANRSLEDAILAQTAYLANLDGKVSPAEQTELDRIKAVVQQLKSPELSPDLDQEFFGVYLRYWLDLRGYEPSKVARSVHRPMLILQGGRDYQVTVPEFNLWKQDLAGRKDVTCKLYPTLNHLFIAGKGPPNPSEYEQPGHVLQQVVEEIAEWVLHQPGVAGH